MRHILTRFASLAGFGILIAIGSKVDPLLTGVSGQVWSLVGFAGAILLWSVYPSEPGHQSVHRGLKCLGFVMLFSMLAIF